MAFSSITILTMVVILTLLAGSAALTYLILMVERNKGNISPSKFNCSIPTPEPYPSCGLQNPITSIPGILGSGFFTDSNRRVMPTFIPPVITPTNSLRMTGYYYAHPTGYYDKTKPRATLFTYPFYLQVVASGSSTVPPSLFLSHYAYSSVATEVSTTPYQQFSFETSGATGGYLMSIPALLNMPALDVDFEPYPVSGGPTLSSVLSSSTSGRKLQIISNQGSPFVALGYKESASTSTVTPVVSISSYNSYTTDSTIVTNPPARTFTTYTFTFGTKCLVWFVDAAVPQSLTVSSGTATLNFLSTSVGNPLDGLVYMTMLSNVGNLLSLIIQTIAEGLNPYYISMTDIITSPDNTAIEYTITPIPGHSLYPGSSTLWILPPTCLRSAGLALVSIPSPLYFDFPIGNGMFRTSLQVGNSALTNFFTIWPPPSGSISDFTSYTLANNGSGVIDTSNQVNSDYDLYNLALAIRILKATPRAKQATPEQINTCSTILSNNLGKVGVSAADYTLFTEQLGNHDAGLVSRISYLLLTYLHSRGYLGYLSIPSSSSGIVENATDQIKILLEGFFTTSTLAEQLAEPGIGKKLYTPLPFLDSYMCTVPDIRTVDLASPLQVSSRLGEVLGYLWAADFLVSGGFLNASAKIPFLARTLYSIVLESTTRLLRGQCVFGETPSLSPVMPWTSYISPSSFGFQADGFSPNGTSPDTSILQTFIPFSPATTVSLTPLISPLQIAVNKLLKCNQPVTQDPGKNYSYNGYVDPELVDYYTYLYTGGDRTHMLLTGAVDGDMTPFIKLISLKHPSVSLLMNQVKLGLQTQVVVTDKSFS